MLANKQIKQFILYLCCGITGVFSDFCIYVITIKIGCHYQVANLFGYSFGTLISFALNRTFTFKVLDRTAWRLKIFFLVAAVGFLASAALLWCFTAFLSLDERMSKILTLPAVVLIQFYLNRKITFQRTG